ncbi:MAG: SidA/IucD/PvdA family monooxygenase [Actinobacteria bacterium]|uniref:Unannotated protein n=1 Tax=freshwater metagenome TaxID=449393 RepID=A0A6J6PDJ3_9ZZZZ|nr:SidA/IucD/PvdA family monooxygenase [Actinomycetota bacterium]MSW31450.1 SidA/IucD/PvdA family monooxygenase [Actinomycetota bacterium]MSX33617.1 SidA/IucD/PvdA family monooxygenase [Actinomycetota bacterium]MSX95590.1 SidA/IucD/PvdA family monooxygenase [Actinomycetota bacterium]MSY24488.1 SidA/IucD/PvdA family monooxygenase [Actinomycetota bacterium]
MRVVIIGAGPGGIVMGKRLLEEGFDEFVILEASDDVGGTWNLNRYPGCECDVQSAMYSFTFEFKPDWTKPYGRQPEILAYMREVADKYGVTPHCRFNDRVISASWDEAASVWTVTTESGAGFQAEILVSAVGMLTHPVWPEIEGRDDFEGAMFHSARWDWSHDFAGERIAVIGSAASAVQFVPEIRKTASQVHLFQRTPNWILPKEDTPYTEAELEVFRKDPTPLLEMRSDIEGRMNRGMTFALKDLLELSEKYGLAALSVVNDPEVRAKLTPDHPFGCKRPLLSNDYFAAFNEPNLELVTEPIARITNNAVVTDDGVEREVDLIVLATGFAATKFAATVDITGRDGVSISAAWSEGAQAYLGVTTVGFPNFFMLYGPNMNNGSIIRMLEYQTEHVLQLLHRMKADELQTLEVKPEVMESYNVGVQEAIDGIDVWNADCNGYYRAPNGRVVTQWPFSMDDYKRRSESIDWSEFSTT